MLKATEDFFDDFTEDFLSENTHRTIIIIGSSKIDESLSIIINKTLLPKIAKPKEPDELLEGDNPLTTFSSRIKMVYRMGFIDISLSNVLDKIRKIRNIGAHQLAFNINSSPLKEHIADLIKLVDQRKSFKLTKQKYFENDIKSSNDKLKCAILSICVLLQAVIIKASKLGIDKSLYKMTKN